MLTGSLAGSQPGAAIETFTILTMAANETVVSVHGCMPFILPLEAYGPWLAGEEVPLALCPTDRLTASPVSAHVNRHANDDPRCVQLIPLA